ncbi:MAG: ATP-binding protein [Nanoarchaeota archaeon]|nr:ATP-binding protein [Nanoarchaeota archaeon]
MIATTPAIKALKIRNYGPIKKADFEFKKGVNVIVGKGGTGKSAVVNAITSALCKHPLIYKKTNGSKKDFEIELELYSRKIKVMPEKQADFYKELLIKRRLPNERKLGILRWHDTSYEDIKQSLGGGDIALLEIAEQLVNYNKEDAIILDDEFNLLDAEHREAAAKLLVKSKMQVIITTTSMNWMPFKKCNVIKL